MNYIRVYPLPLPERARKAQIKYSQSPLYGHPLNTDTPLLSQASLVCPWGKKALTFSLNSIRLIRTLSMAPSVSALTSLRSRRRKGQGIGKKGKMEEGLPPPLPPLFCFCHAGYVLTRFNCIILKYDRWVGFFYTVQSVSYQ